MTNLHLITSKQLQLRLAEKIQVLYEQQLNHQLSQVTCKIFNNTIVLVMEGVTTRPEQVLTEFDRKELAQEMRTVLDRTILPKIQKIIEEMMPVNVVDFLCDTTLETGRAGIIAIFEFHTEANPRIELA